MLFWKFAICYSNIIRKQKQDISLSDKTLCNICRKFEVTIKWKENFHSAMIRGKKEKNLWYGNLFTKCHMKWQVENVPSECIKMFDPRNENLSYKSSFSYPKLIWSDFPSFSTWRKQTVVSSTSLMNGKSKNYKFFEIKGRKFTAKVWHVEMSHRCSMVGSDQN